jgi:hypothetical protein
VWSVWILRDWRWWCSYVILAYYLDVHLNFIVHTDQCSIRVTKNQVGGYIQNIPDWCCHLYSSCGSAKHRYMVTLPCLVSQCAKLHVAKWTLAVFTRVWLWVVWFQCKSGIFWIDLCTFLIFGVCRPDTLQLCEQGCEDPWLFFECRTGLRANICEKYWCTGSWWEGRAWLYKYNGENVTVDWK